MISAPTVRLGLAGHDFREQSLGELLELWTQRFAVDALDLWPWNVTGTPRPELRRALDDAGVRVFAVNVPSTLGRIGKPGEREKARESIRTAIEQAVELDAPYVQFYAGIDPHLDAIASVKSFVRDVHPLVEEAERAGVVLLLENNFDQWGEDVRQLNVARRPEMLRHAVEQTGSSHLRVCFDPCNFYVCGIEPFPYAYELLQEYVENVHLKDCCRYSPLLHDPVEHEGQFLRDQWGGEFVLTPVGSGAISWEPLLRRLHADGFAGWYTVDPFSGPRGLLEWCDASLAFVRGALERAATADAVRLP